MHKTADREVSNPPLRPRAPVFRAASAYSVLPDTSAALQELAAQLGLEDAGAPDFVTLHYGGGRPAQEVCTQATVVLGAAALHGGSSCLGVMTEQGAAIAQGDAIGAFAIWDAQGAYGTGACPLGEDPRAAAAQATRAALQDAGRMGEAPDLVWLTAAPGHEEQVLLGIKDVVGCPALIVGGSSADNDVSGGWSQITAQGAHTNSVVVSVLFPSVQVGCSFESGYAPTGKQGVVTHASGRTVHSIDARPAADVYSDWTQGAVAVPQTGSASVLAQATMFPLGRRLTEIDDVTFHMLAHPAVAHADGRLDFFADLTEGQTVWLMSGSEDSLVERAGRIAASSRDNVQGAISGALVIYCGGCMLSVTHRMDEVAENVAQALAGAPFLGVFSFGEQGETLCGDSEHGNLMISCISFGAENADTPALRIGLPQ
jgi:hypothetical protein